MRKISIVTAASLALVSAGSLATVLVPAQPQNLVLPSVTASISIDPHTQAYHYEYTVANQSAAQQSIWLFSVNTDQNARLTNIVAPVGWRGISPPGTSTMGWAATEIPQNSNPDNGNVLPSPYQISPGATITGYSFDTFSPPGAGSFFAQGFAPLPQVDGDAEELGPLPDPRTNGISGQVQGPMGSVIPDQGGRRPAVDGFLVFLNLKKGDVFQSPATIVVKFSIAGEQVSRDTFKALLNGVDVTSSFQPDRKWGGDLAATFDTAGSPLTKGSNVLETEVTGVVPGTTRTAQDRDRVVFTVQ